MPEFLRRVALADRRWLLLITVAVGIRLALMPFTLHMDAYQIYSRASEAAYDGEWFGWTAQILIQSIHNVWLLLIKPILPDSAGIWSKTASEAGVGASIDDYRQFIAYEHVHRAVFLMKFPYFVADMLVAWVLTRLVEPARRFVVAAFWLLNPLVIYATAVFGRHDVIAILLVLLSLLAARRATDAGRLLGLVLLGVATLMRFFPIVLVPFYLIAFRRSRRQLIAALAILGGLWGAVELFGIIGTGESPTLEILATHEHFQNWLDAGIRLRFDDFIFFFPLLYIIGLLWISERDLSADEYPTVAAGSFLLLFALTFFHPHWSIWLVPFLALTIASNRRLVIYHAIQVIALTVYFMQWGSWTTWELLRPTIGDRVASMPDPYEAIDARIEPRQFFGVFRSLLTAVSLWMAWKLIDPLRRHRRA